VSREATNTPESYRVWLQTELEARKRHNTAYSLRAYAASLGLSPATLSQVMAGKRPLTRKAAMKIADRANLSPDERRHLLASVLAEAIGAPPEAPATAAADAVTFRELEADQFCVIADWYHYAVLSLSELPGSRASAAWIAEMLGITVHEAEAALRRLQRLGLIEVRGRAFRQSSPPLTTPPHVANQAIRKFHRQVLRKAEAALADVPVEERDFGAITFAADSRTLPRVREALREFRRKIASLMAGSEPDQVYTLSLQLVPVSKRQRRSKSRSP
jgi:uncharacterized protein (TIGR02147 family)